MADTSVPTLYEWLGGSAALNRLTTRFYEHVKADALLAPVFVHGDRVVIRWIFDFDWLDGSTTHMEELAYQRWEGEQIAEETFFYDPAQRAPKRPAGAPGGS